MNGHANTSSVKQQHATLSTINQMLENTEVAIKNGQSRETGNLRYTRHKKKTNKQTNKQQQQQKRNTVCVEPHYV
jgi:hypothetical protein